MSYVARRLESDAADDRFVLEFEAGKVYESRRGHVIYVVRATDVHHFTEGGRRPAQLLVIMLSPEGERRWMTGWYLRHSLFSSVPIA